MSMTPRYEEGAPASDPPKTWDESKDINASQTTMPLAARQVYVTALEQAQKWTMRSKGADPTDEMDSKTAYWLLADAWRTFARLIKRIK